MKYERLFSPIRIGTMEVKNRVVMAAMHTMYNQDGYACPRFNEYFYARAEGGCGLVTVGGAAIDDYGGAFEIMRLDDDRFIPGYKEFTDGMHARGAKVAVQLFHAGRYAYSAGNGGRQPIAPSAVYSGYSKEMPREMTVEEIHETIRRGADAALRAKKAGFDMVEISGSAGYLICQFNSPLTNLRTDEYGGSRENRFRFAREYVAAVREAVGQDYPVAMRIAGNDLVPGSNTNEDAVAFAVEMEKAGIDFINMTGGWHESKVPQITAELPRGGWNFLAAEIKKAVNIPVAVSNRINDPKVAEVLLATGVADMISLGRPLIADPDWCRKAENGEEDLIRKCMACNQGCLARVFFSRPSECLVNGRVGREYETKDLSVATGDDVKNILVIGGGPGGCEFAIRASERGHRVTLWEKDEKLGGQLWQAAAPPHKQEFYELIRYYENALRKSGAHVVLNKNANAEDVKSFGADMVVVAAGRGEPTVIPVNNPEGVPVCTSNDVLLGKVIPGKNVLVIGGASVGCETAQYLAQEASVSAEQCFHMLKHGYESYEEIERLVHTCWRNITVVDIARIGSGFDAGTAWPVMKDLDRLGVKRYPFTSVVEIAGGKAVLAVRAKKDSEETTRVEVPCDSIVMAVGAKPNNSLAAELEEAGIQVYSLGDSVKLSNVLGAVRQACELAERL
ncbi:MAG: FAD-dependent oxidoreductase [Lachnospiraceae bacterium]|nr:FAD-dependent oxidoreductase [Lachnospiraceae bacterium]